MLASIAFGHTADKQVFEKIGVALVVLIFVPAMQIGLTHRVWEIEELVALIA